MLSKQKIIKMIVLFSVMMFLSITIIFFAPINYFFKNFMFERFNVVSNSNNMLVHFIDVDQGDAIAINLPDGKVMLIDNGSKDYNVTFTNYMHENVLNSKKDNFIDYLVLSHADSDHIGGTMRLLKNFVVGTVFMPIVQSESQTFQEINDYVAKNCNSIIMNGLFYLEGGGYQICFFEQLNLDNTNDSSQVIKLEYLNKSFLFTGDISSSVEKEYIEKYKNELDCDVLKVSHHGSKTATSTEFLMTVSPKYAVISVGEKNNYGHPHDELISRLQLEGVEILRTDNDGDVLFVLGDDYGLKHIEKNYYITALSLNYVYFVFFTECILCVVCVVVLIKKEKLKKVK